ncbi:erythroblast NAD(P)(+)--arginine ADP-ribosyltransferase-like [Lepisosteus oculatus]|uniref:erythroblast NAD(P)(+)--arginine ADP-ribosyltransferase-like n=1 Tax=Lepisosteus oculatus TaxID=7918 RepID=UPI00372377A4
MWEDRTHWMIVCFVGLGAITSGEPTQSFPHTVKLDMAENSVDDQYLSCQTEMLNVTVKGGLLEKEKKENHLFREAWDVVECTEPVPGGTPEHCRAIFVYTSNSIYLEFNKATRSSGGSVQDYMNTYPYKSLHFLLTDALRLLRQQLTVCYKVYRGSREDFVAEVNSEIRFGQFSSSSKDEAFAHFFGDTTFFEIQTCHGVDIEMFSQFPAEAEVLIPPFEKFKVKSVTETDKGKKKIVLQSRGTYSNHACSFFPSSRSSPCTLSSSVLAPVLSVVLLLQGLLG